MKAKDVKARGKQQRVQRYRGMEHDWVEPKVAQPPGKGAVRRGGRAEAGIL